MKIMEQESFLKQAAYHFCNYQERCHSEVRYKLIELGARGAELEQILSDLIEDGLLNEERFARSYVRGKFRNNQWGRKKIVQVLRQKQVSDYCINKGLIELDEKEYNDCIEHLAARKAKELKAERSAEVRKQKILRYLLQKGFEYELSNKAISNIF